jgi:hypothetical protein
MKLEVRVPTLSDSVASGTLLPWRKQVGETVARECIREEHHLTLSASSRRANAVRNDDDVDRIMDYAIGPQPFITPRGDCRSQPKHCAANLVRSAPVRILKVQAELLPQSRPTHRALVMPLRERESMEVCAWVSIGDPLMLPG